MNILRTLIRPMIAAPFIADGVDAVRRPKAHTKKMQPYAPLLRRCGLSYVADNPVLATRVTGVATIVAGSLLAVGKFPRTSAAVLTAISIPTSVIQTSAEKTTADKISSGIHRGALTGAMVLAALDRQGEPSVAWRASNWMNRQRILAAAKWNSLRDSAESELDVARSNVSALLG
ncbi:DoxX family protein [Boudabousia marimammalium]|uniref:DoxX family protein n=1 Tax=Boudabousia marimammalium TaxID=156892 RepID=A0A1Q5PRK7_9ACTO|nr:DoxX family protein [Boudabousia marimammalium]OKL50186.1 hypothetical protein BM477_01980 [Boudabousia marimammalium]